MTSTRNSCYMYLCPVVKKNRGGGIEGSNFGYEYHFINTSHDVTESRNKQDAVQIRPLVRRNLYAELKKN
jgi:hypothetical protein